MTRKLAPTRAPLIAAVAALAVLLSLPTSLCAQSPHREILAEKFRAELQSIAREAPGVVGVQVIDLEAGRRFGVNEEIVFPQGSTIKIPILVELYRQASAGTLSLEGRVPIRAEAQVGGSGVLAHFGDAASRLSLHDLAVLMVVLSDNTATNLLIERVGMANVNRTMRRLDLEEIRLQREMMDVPARARGDENLATPAAAAALMARIHSCELPMPEAACAELRGLLEIPKSGDFTAPIPPGVPIAWKPGGIPSVAAAWGLVGLSGRPYAIAVMTNYGGAADVGETIRRVSDAAFEYFNRLAATTEYGTKVPLELLRDARPLR